MQNITGSLKSAKLLPHDAALTPVARPSRAPDRVEPRQPGMLLSVAATPPATLRAATPPGAVMSVENSLPRSVIDYRIALAGVAPEHLAIPKAPQWAPLMDLITPEVLEHAHKQGELLRSYVPTLQLQLRPAKTMQRIEAKRAEHESRPWSKPTVGFKVNSDHLACRINAAPQELASTVQRFTEEAQRAGCQVHLRYPVVDEKGAVTDIVSYMFAYSPALGHMAEVQIGHPFATWTFTRDSLLRDEPATRTHKVDVWDQDFYPHVVARLLKKPGHEAYDLGAELDSLLAGKDDEIELRELLRASGVIS